MQGRITDIQHFSLHDGPGIRTTVFFKGCPLSCRWCHNPETIDFEPELLQFSRLCTNCGSCLTRCRHGALSEEKGVIRIDRALCSGCGDCSRLCASSALILKGESLGLEEILSECLLDRSFYKKEGGVTLSGGEPLVQVPFVLALLEALKKEGIHTVLDTCGYVGKDTFKASLGLVDLYYYDVKSMDSEAHHAWTGMPNHRILANLAFLLEARAPLVVRVPLIPGFNDTVDNFEALADFLEPYVDRVEIHILPYHKYGINKYAALGRVYLLDDLDPPDIDLVESLANVLKQVNLKVTVFS